MFTYIRTLKLKKLKKGPDKIHNQAASYQGELFLVKTSGVLQLTISLLPQFSRYFNRELSISCIWIHRTHCCSISTGEVVQVPPARREKRHNNEKYWILPTIFKKIITSEIITDNFDKGFRQRAGVLQKRLNSLEKTVGCYVNPGLFHAFEEIEFNSSLPLTLYILLPFSI